MRDLSKRQKDVLKFIAARVEGGVPPTIHEICRRFNWSSTKSAADHLRALQKKGAIEREYRSARCIRITKAGWEAL